MANTKHYLVTPSGPLELPYEKHFFFGRAEGNNIVVDDMRASRRHAEIWWDGSNFLIMDLNSSNGTYVNDETISTKVLQDRDEVQIGLQSYIFRAVQTTEELDTSVKQLRKDTRAMQTAEMPALGATLPPDDFNGTLATTSLAEICQMLELGQRSGMLLVMNENKEKGILYFDKGQIVSAECGLLQGNAAALRILTWRKGNFSLRSEHPSFQRNVTQKTSALLLEAARQGDESSRG